MAGSGTGTVATGVDSGKLKIDIIKDAFSQMRISGITVMPSSESNTLALKRLESMANELEGRNVCVNYNFEDLPDINSPSGVSSKYWYAFSCVLASRLLSDFGKGMQPDQTLLKNASAGSSFLYSSTAVVSSVPYPNRQSIGKGNRLTFGPSYYPTSDPVPQQNESKSMVIGDIENFVEHFDAYLIYPEVISSYTIEASTGLTVVSSSNTDEDVSYQIDADGNSNMSEVLNVKIVMTSSTGRIKTRLIDFILSKSEEIS